jgi:hypothetical protein
MSANHPISDGPLPHDILYTEWVCVSEKERERAQPIIAHTLFENLKQTDFLAGEWRDLPQQIPNLVNMELKFPTMQWCLNAANVL